MLTADSHLPCKWEVGDLGSALFSEANRFEPRLPTSSKELQVMKVMGPVASWLCEDPFVLSLDGFF